MTDKGIIFAAPMVRALLDGRKTQTRRLLKGMPEAPSPDSLVHQPRHDVPYFDAYCGKPKTAVNPRGMSDYWCWWTRDDREGRGMKVPYVPGQRLYVRESALYWIRSSDNQRDKVAAFKADGYELEVGERWTPSIHMPRKFSRLWLAVTDVRVQRLQECSDADAEAEGFDLNGADPTVPAGLNAYHWYASLWDSLHTAEVERWQDNPWVVAVSFDVRRGNIDAEQVA